jgi:CIC family chloride channel protein
MGGIVIGAILLLTPAVMGVGYEYVDQALNGGLLLRTMVLLCLLKLVATVVSYASGNAGGIFAPSLYIGAMAGGAVGIVVHRVAPFPTAEVGAYALVGMGALFAGIIRAPMTSVFMIFEITQDYQILVPLMVANMLSFVISRRFQPTPIYHALLQQDRVHLPSPFGRSSASSPTTARQIMGTDVHLIPVDATADQACLIASEHPAPMYLVGSSAQLRCSVSRSALEQWKDSKPDERLESLVGDSFVHVHPDHPLEVVLERWFQSGGVLPVVSRADARRLEGVITRESILNRPGPVQSPETDGGLDPLV